MNKGFTLLECILCLVLLGVIGAGFTQGACQLLVLKASKSAFMESIPMIDSEISAIRHNLRYHSDTLLSREAAGNIPGYTCKRYDERTPDLLTCSITVGGETTEFFVDKATNRYAKEPEGAPSATNQ
ncbi:MAG: prepilin-type N-terminal cleavage/methylation domain-containing protein [Desulfovibrionaceae bacterium]|nr:prepilin-type N-terminal cleavage/methylation domain-containing protein [Desulfovibrionaceae bacterium]